jgi:enterochelin esterase-like enzyme
MLTNAIYSREYRNHVNWIESMMTSTKLFSIVKKIDFSCIAFLAARVVEAMIVELLLVASFATAQEKLTEKEVPEAAAKLIERAKAEGSSVWIENGKLIFFHQAETDGVQVKITTQSKPMKRIAGSDVWTCQVSLPNVEKGMMSYGFIETTKGKPVGASGQRFWRGPKAPKPLRFSDSLKGSVDHHDFASASLGETRTVSVYLPSSNRKIEYVVYMSDGDATDGYAHILEPTMEDDELPPIALIGTHSGVYRGEVELSRDDTRRNVRALEYVPSLDPSRFQQHETFFTQEVLSWAEKKYPLPTSTESRVVFGFSNGGSFSATMGIRHPELYGSVIACAIAGDRYDLSKSPRLSNEFFLVTGTWDTRFHSNVEYLCKALKKAKVKCSLAVRAADHDGKMWQEEFISALKAIAK